MRTAPRGRPELGVPSVLLGMLLAVLLAPVVAGAADPVDAALALDGSGRHQEALARLLRLAVDGSGAQAARAAAAAARIQVERRDPEAAESLARAALGRDPDQAEARRVLARIARGRGDPAGAVAELRAALAQTGDPGIGGELAEALLADARPREAAEVLAGLAEATPEDGETHALLGRARAASGDAAGAEAAFARAAGAAGTPAPLRLEALVALGHLRLGGGDPEGAREAWLRALELDPGDEAAARGLASVVPDARLRTALVDALHPAPRDLTAVDLAGIASLPQPEVALPAQVVLDERVFEVDGERLARRTVHRIVRVGTESGARSLSELYLPFDSAGEEPVIHRARTFTPDGAEHVFDRNTAFRTSPPGREEGGLHTDQRLLVLALPAVHPGSVLEVVVTFVSRGPLPEVRWSDEMSALHPFPVGLARYVVRLPPELEPRISLPDGWTEVSEAATPESPPGRVFERRAVPAFAAEDGMPPADVVHPGVVVTPAVGWGDVASWFHAGFAPRTYASAEVAARARRAVEGAGSDREGVARILHAVERDVRYVGLEFGEGAFVPVPAHEVATRRMGDCKGKTALLAAMLDVVGIRAVPALVRSGGPADLDRGSPAVRQFNHVVAWVPDVDGGLFVDPTSRDGTVGVVPPGIAGREALIVDGGGGSPRILRTPAPTAEEHRFEESVRMRLAEDGTASGEEVTVATGWLGAIYKDLYRSLGTPEVRARIRPYVDSYYGEGSLRDLEILDADRPEADFHMRLTFDGGRPAAAARDRLRLDLPPDFLEETLRVPGRPARRWPVWLDVPRQVRRIVHVTLPEGWAMPRVPDPVVRSGPAGTYALTVQARGREVEIAYSLTLREIHFPAEAWPGFLAFVDDVRAASRLVLTFARDDSRTDLARLEERLEVDPADADVLYRVGLVHLRWGRFEQAVQAFQRSLVLDAASVAAHISLASALESLERIPEAIAELRWVVDRRPRDFRSWTRLSALCERQGDLDAAVEALERSVAANPYLDETRHQLVRVTALRDALTEEHP